MALNLKLVLALSVLTLGKVSAHDSSEAAMRREYLTVKKIKVVQIERDVLNQDVRTVVNEQFAYSNSDFSSVPGIPKNGGVDPTDKVGKIIAYGKDLVALGESIYNLVIKGKPSNKTTYAPVSVVPRTGSEAVDIFDMEGWSEPKSRTYEVICENGFGFEVINFRYSVLYSYGGSYNGTGSYITAAQILPIRVNTAFGYDFAATMKVGGLQNVGTKANPVASLIMIMQYDINTVFQATIDTVTFHVTGKGALKRI